MGYILFLVVALIVVAGIALISAGNKKPKQGRISGHGEAILREQPSADEPTPARSGIAPARHVQAAQKHTPPA